MRAITHAAERIARGRFGEHVKSIRLAFMLAPIWLLGAATACSASNDAHSDELRAQLEREYPGFSIDAVRPMPLDGIYEVVSGTQVLYLSADGRYLLRGSLVDLESEQDLTAARRAGLMHAAVEAGGDDRMLIYEPAGGDAEHEITVFTDTSCPYCQRLHADLMSIVENHPVRVRYLLYPRAGVDSAAADTMRDVWCAADPHAAMTAAQRGRSVPERASDCGTPVEDHFALGQKVGVSGTPFLLFGEDGPTLSGYRPRAQLLSMLGIAP